MSVNDSATSLPGELEAGPDDVQEQQDDAGLSYAQLREIYDSEEIERVMQIFSTHVTEVRAPTSSYDSTIQHTLDEEDNEHDRDTGWLNIHEQPPSLSRDIAQRYILPHLPPPRSPAPAFTFGRLRLTIQRFYLVIEPIYIPFIHRLLRLATWENKPKSGFYCTVFWGLWLFDLLLPAFLLQILYALLRRRLFPYPTLDELRERRREVKRADYLGDVISSRLTASSSFGIREMWRLFQAVNKPKKNRIKKAMTSPRSSVDDVQDEATLLDDSGESEEERDVKRLGLLVLNEFADLHERVKNLFIWRRPEPSRIFGMLIFIAFLGTLFLPAKWVAKIVYLIPGFIFWHIVPVISSMDRQERTRLPPPLAGVPTDAEYAMHVVSYRVASGQTVRPQHKKHKQHARGGPDNSDVSASSTSFDLQGDGKKSIDWKKWNDRAAVGKAWAGEGKRLIQKGAGKMDSPNTSPIIPGPALAIGQAPRQQDVYSYPCQHSTAPGLVTLTPTVLYFTPFMSSNPTVTIILSRLQGVKKAGLMKGLTLKWRTDDDRDKEEIFRWVANREEMFARLIGLEGKQWIKT